ncbi:MAG: TIM barrel protein [Bacteroidetes bacterium]|nr:TIM barrel protein [Bacteroidota bacterium]
MRRRAFVKLGMTGFAASAVPTSQLFGRDRTESQTISRSIESFQLNYAPHLGMFRHHAGEDPVDQLNFMADEEFTAFEDNGMRERDIAVQNVMAQTMANRGIQMGVFVAHKIYWNEPNLASGDPDWREEFLSFIRQSVDVARRVGAKWMTVVPGFVALRKDMGYQTANVVESLKRACDILEPHGLVMVLEPLNPRDHPGLFLTKISQAYEVCKAVASPACKILDDLYHQQITEGNLIPNINAAWNEIAYFQIGDNPGRKEPTTGEINYKNVFHHIHQKGFSGILGMEHGNSIPGPAGERAVIDAYRYVDSF